MPILSELSRRFHLLTVDAKPDPPRSRVAGSLPGTLPTLDSESKSREQTSAKVNKAVAAEEASATIRRCNSDKRSDETSGPNCKTKEKSKSRKAPCKANVIKYNIINSHKVNIGSRTSYICNVHPCSTEAKTVSGEGLSANREARVMPESVELLTSCADVINPEDMFLVKTHVGRGWTDIARKLDYSDGQIDQFEENHRHKGIGEVVYQILLDWRQSKTSEAQVGILANTMWACQEYDCVERWAAVRRQRM